MMKMLGKLLLRQIRLFVVYLEDDAEHTCLSFCACVLSVTKFFNFLRDQEVWMVLLVETV
jgi:hypothetical protein